MPGGEASLASALSLARHGYKNPSRFSDPSGHLGKDNVVSTDDGYCGTDKPTYKKPAKSTQYSDSSGNEVCVDNGGHCFDHGQEFDWDAFLVGYYPDVNTGGELEKFIDWMVPDDGTKGIGISGTAGAGIYFTGSMGINMDSHGNAVFSISIGGGGMLPGAAEIALFSTWTNLENVDQLRIPVKLSTDSGPCRPHNPVMSSSERSEATLVNTL